VTFSFIPPIYYVNESEAVHNVDTLWTDNFKNRIFAALRRKNARSVRKATGFADRHELVLFQLQTRLKIEVFGSSIKNDIWGLFEGGLIPSRSAVVADRRSVPTPIMAGWQTPSIQ
jgi:hypothetical protein